MQARDTRSSAPRILNAPSGDVGRRRLPVKFVIALIFGAFMCSLITTQPASAAPTSFLEPYPCGENWKIYTHNNHTPWALDMIPLGQVAMGSPIVASEAGTVTTAANLGDGYGNQIIITHASGWKTRYAHLSAFNVAQGDPVLRGKWIGNVGSTGNSTGPHLHYEQILNGATQPITWGSYAVPTPYPNIDLQQSTSHVSVNCGQAQPPDPAQPPGLSFSANASAITQGNSTRTFWHGTDNNLWNRTSTNGTWGAYGKLADGIKYQPGSTTTADGKQWLHWTGTDNNIWGGWLNGNTITGGMQAAGVSGPPIVIGVGNAVHMFYRGADANLWHVYSGDGVNWSTDFVAWSIEGYPAVTVTSGANPTLYVFWKGTDKNLWEKHLTGASWQGPFNIAPGILSVPSAASVGTAAHVFYTGEDRNVWHLYNGGGGWAGPEVSATGAASAPSASAGGTTLFLTWKGLDDQVWLSRLDGATWNGAYAGGPGVASGPISSSVGNASGATEVFWVDAAQTMWRRSYYSNAWQGIGQAAVGVAFP